MVAATAAGWRGQSGAGSGRNKDGTRWLTVPEAGEVWRSETLERYVGTDDRSWLRFIDPYYLYRTAGLVIPWIALHPLALTEPWWTGHPERPETRRLWSVVVAAMIVLSFPLGRRWYYMLPVLAPLAVLMADAALDARRRLAGSRRGRWTWAALLIAHALSVGVLCLLLIRRNDARLDLDAGEPVLGPE